MHQEDADRNVLVIVACKLTEVSHMHEQTVEKNINRDHAFIFHDILTLVS
jgi:hypothetical protein